MTQLELLKLRITYSEDTFEDVQKYEATLNRLLEDSKYIGLSLRFPYKDYAEEELPKKYNNWQLRCAEQLYSLIGNEGVISYSENGLSWTRDSSSIAPTLANEIDAMVGYITEEE